jgi:Flp pilus assembly protein TadD
MSDAQYEFEEGVALFNRGQYEQAIPRFQRATELDPNFARAYLYLGRSHVSLRRWSQALSPLRTAYRLAPEETRREAMDFLIDALFAVGLEELRAGNFSSSIERLSEVLELQPGSARATNELVKTLIAQGGDSLARGNVSQAVTAYGRAVKLSPDNFEAYLGLAKGLFRNGDFLKARDALQEATKINPGSPEVRSLSSDLQRR